jgi:hypothetical protein
VNWFFQNPILNLLLLWLPFWAVLLFYSFIVELTRRENVRIRCAEILRKFHLYGTPALVWGLLLYVCWQFDWFLPGTPSNIHNQPNPGFEKAHPQTSVQTQKGIDDDNARFEQYRADKKYQPATPDIPTTLAPTPTPTPEKVPRATLVATAQPTSPEPPA